jgi:hypothetical protein
MARPQGLIGPSSFVPSQRELEMRKLAEADATVQQEMPELSSDLPPWG